MSKKEIGKPKVEKNSNHEKPYKAVRRKGTASETSLGLVLRIIGLAILIIYIIIKFKK